MPMHRYFQCSTLVISEYRARCRTNRAAEYFSLLGPVRHHFTRACSIRLFGSAYQPGSALVLDYDFFCKNLPISCGFWKTVLTGTFSPLRVGVLLALFACSTLRTAHLLGGLLDSAARKTVTSIGLFGSTARSTTLATPPCIRFGIRHQNRAERGTLD